MLSPLSEGAPTPPEAGAALLARLRPHARRDLGLASVAAGVQALAIVAQAWLIARLLHGAIVEHSERPALAPFFVALMGAIILRVLASFWGERLSFRGGLSTVRAVRVGLLQKLERAGPIALGVRPAGEIVALMSEGTRAIEPFFSRYLPARVLAALLPLLIFIVILPIDRLSAAVLIVTAPLIPLFMVFIGKGAEALNIRQWRQLQRLSGHFLDAIQGLAIIKAFNAGPRMVAAVGAAAERYRQNTMAVLRIAFLSSLALEFFATVSIAMLAVFIGFRLMWGQMPYQDGLFVLLLAPEFYAPLRAMGAAYHARMEALGAADRLAALERQWAQATPATTGSLLTRFDHVTLRFEDVSLTYEGEREALQQVSFNVAQGHCVALVGPSGAGKSSLFHLVMGYASPGSGRILVNGIPLAALEPETWRRHISYVPQRPVLMGASVAENIALGEPAPDRARVRRSAENAGISTRIEALPLGYDTIIGDGGATLSGGEVHRIALARALYRESPLLLLDEPTAHLDKENAAIVHATIAKVAPGRTVMMIVHNPDLLALADTVVTLEAGRVSSVEQRSPHVVPSEHGA